MEKPASLREHLVSRLPELARDPERLKLWIDQGTVRSSQTANLSFQYGYTLNLLVTDWTAHPSILFVLLLEWLRRHQPDLVASNSAPGFAFEADVIDKNVVDLQVTLALSEAVITTRRNDGGWDMQHLVEPETMFPDDSALSAPAAPLTELWWRDERVLPLPDPAP